MATGAALALVGATVDAVARGCRLLGSVTLHVHDPTPDTLAFAVRHGVHGGSQDGTVEWWDLEVDGVTISVFGPRRVPS